MDRLKEWFLGHQRDLPWRKNRTPYRVWISEIMLQQTQVAVVIPYFLTWMQKFPTIDALAQARLEQVVKTWEGLGYYSRARNLHATAHIVMQRYGGDLPSDGKELQKLPGFGPYTVGAVLSFAFQKKAPAVDGNVIRVLSRYLACDKNSSQRAYFEQLTQQLLPEQEAWVTMEALIELGAMICQKTPKCTECPLQNNCRAYQEKTTAFFPLQKQHKKIVRLRRDVAVICCGNSVLVRKELEGKLMAGLYEFPYVACGDKFPFDWSMVEIKSLPVVKHSFTNYEATLFPTIYKTDQYYAVEGFEWKTWAEISQFPFSSGHRRILELLRGVLHNFL